ncbi:MAG: hypothetical protein P9L90_05700 [Candidatus Aadella gelida]|nr:hypothetical protein [Candidatus Aadella gelida]
MKYRLTKDDLVSSLSAWNRFFNRKVHLIACGGTALTLLGVKNSTKDVDFMVPMMEEYKYLISTIKEIGYYPIGGWGWQREGEEYIFDLFRGNNIHTTELLESPLKEGNNTALFELTHLYVGILNHYDLLISKLFRGDSVDIDDCLMLVKLKREEIDISIFKKRFIGAAKYDHNEEKQNKTLRSFLKILEKENIHG